MQVHHLHAAFHFSHSMHICMRAKVRSVCTCVCAFLALAVRITSLNVCTRENTVKIAHTIITLITFTGDNYSRTIRFNCSTEIGNAKNFCTKCQVNVYSIEEMNDKSNVRCNAHMNIRMKEMQLICVCLMAFHM